MPFCSLIYCLFEVYYVFDLSGIGVFHPFGFFHQHGAFGVIMNPDKGDVQIFQNLEVVPDGEVTNPNLQISLSDARADNDPEAEIGEEHTKEIIFADFGRRAILNLRQTLQSKILDLQKEAIYTKFKEIEGELITAEVYQTRILPAR